MKTLILISFISLSSLVYAQHCPDSFTEKQLLELAHTLENNIPEYVKLREWARTHNRPDIEKATNSLEWFAKDRVRYIRKYAKKDFKAVCNRMFHPKYKEHLSDAIVLGIYWSYLQINGVLLNDIDFSKY